MLMISSVLEKRWARRLHYRYMSVLFKKGNHIFVAPYSKLSRSEHMEFDWRAHYFLATTKIEFHNFENAEGIPFQRIRLLIASIAAQMTFRLPDNCFLIYDRIIIYPDYYFSRLSGQYHKGETNPAAGVMVFSLRGITEGFNLPYDGVNLLYHEMAHGLYLEHKGMTYNLFDEETLERVERYGRHILANEQPEDFFLRAYALTNIEEFFAVATENFFERPENFSRSMPELYMILQDLYRQDPLTLK